MIIFLGYSATLVIGFMLSFGPWRQPGRRFIRITTVVLRVPLVLSIGLFALLSVVSFLAEPPSIETLSHDFPSRQADLKMILRMSNEDSQFSRIAPTFVFVNVSFAKSYMYGDPNAGLPKEQWDEYRKIYARNGIKLGVQRNKAGDAFIMVDSVGLLNRGHATGYLYCVPDAPKENRFYPRLLHAADGHRDFDPAKREKAYSFHRLNAEWFPYYEGPS